MNQSTVTIKTLSPRKRHCAMSSDGGNKNVWWVVGGAIVLAVLYFLTR